MASPTQWRVWVNSGSWWWTGWLCCSLWGWRVGHDWATELNWTFMGLSLHNHVPSPISISLIYLPYPIGSVSLVKTDCYHRWWRGNSEQVEPLIRRRMCWGVEGIGECAWSIGFEERLQVRGWNGEIGKKYSLPLNNMGLNGLGPRIYRFLQWICATVLHYPQLVESADAKPKIQGNQGYGWQTQSCRWIFD